jgi:hypothetical protein
MHASISRFTGDPDELLRRYRAMLEDVPPSAMAVHLCLRAPDGLVVVDTCPSREDYARFAAGGYAVLRVRHGMPAPIALEHLLVEVAFAAGTRIVDEAVVR